MLPQVARLAAEQQHRDSNQNNINQSKKTTMFSQVKQNDQLIVVESGNNFKVYRVQVTENGKQSTVMNGQNQPVQVVSVIKATDGQQPFEFKELPANSNVFTYPNGTIVAVSRDAMAIEMKRLNAFSTDVINSVQQHRAIKAGTEKVLEEIDTEYAEKRQMREQLELLRQQNEELRKANEAQAKMMDDVSKEIKSLRDELKTSKSKEK